MTNSAGCSLTLIDTDRLVLSQTMSTMKEQQHSAQEQGGKEGRKQEAMIRPGLRRCQLSLRHPRQKET